MNSDPLYFLNHINPAMLTYEEWCGVGMALKHEGATVHDFESWSQRDTSRYHRGECARKWESFRGNGNPKTIATLVALAKQHGWTPQRVEHRAYDWDEVINDPYEGDGSYRFIDSNWIEDQELPEPSEWNPVQDLARYLSTLFESSEHVGYVTAAWYNEEAKRHLPQKGCWDRTAGQLIAELNKCKGDIGSVIGDYKPEVGAWIRFNPLDGNGAKDSNVAAFRYALVESDEMAISRQYALLKELELPIAAMVHSGGKSVHAIVKVEADTMEEYRKRVDFLYEVCGRNGLKLDRQNRNPSRLSRMPGVTRNGHKQWLVATNIGKPSWHEWEEWVSDLNDDLPDIEEFDVSKKPQLAPVLIDGILREGHKMLLSGSSKAGKSFALIQLAIAVAEGREWLGWKVGQGKVLYVNLELDQESCRQRFCDIYKHAGVAQSRGMLDIWNLRGSATSLDKLAPKLIRRALKKQYKAVIIDPIYKVLTGDENSAEQMALFCNQFDKICTQLGAATIYCHHHSKGAQGQKQSHDRSSGSGVFARDPDAIIDLIELDIDQNRRKQIINRWECDAMALALDRTQRCAGWRDYVSQDDALVADKLFAYAEQYIPTIRDVRFAARQAAEDATGWRVESTLREFRKPPARQMFFRYPVHLIDEWGFLADAKAEGEEPLWMKNRVPPEEKKKRRENEKQERKRERVNQVEIAVQSKFGEEMTIQELAELLECTVKTARNRIAEHGGYCVKDSVVCPMESEPAK